MRSTEPSRPFAPIARAAVAFFGWLGVFLLCGCDGTHLAGTHDVELDYVIDPSWADPARKANDSGAVGATEARARLVAGHVTADVSGGAGHVRVVLDESLADGAEELLLWRGGLALYRVDPDFHIAPPAGSGLVEQTVRLADGSTDRYLVGPPAAVTKVVQTAQAAHIEAGHKIFAESIDANTARTRVVFDPPLADEPDGIDKADVARHGHAVAVQFKARTLAELTPIVAHAGAPIAPIAIVRGRAVLAVRKLAATDLTPLTIDFGNDLYSYARAQRVSLLLATPAVPPLVRAARTPQPDDWPMAIVGLVLPMLLSFGWLFFVRRFDRGEPEPMWLVMATFALGGLSVIPAGLAEYGLMTASPYLNPSLVTLGGQPIAFPLALAVFTLVVGFSEEGSKFLGAWSLARHRREFDEPVDGIVYGVASGLGFAAVENVKYFAVGRLTPTLIVMRTFSSVPAHMFFAAIWGYALGQKLISRKTSVFLFLAWAALMHGAFDTFLSLHGTQILAPVLNFVLATLFVYFLRRALRHGVVRAGLPPAPMESRALFGMGSRFVFTVWAVAMHALAVAVFALGIYFEMTHRRVSWAFLAVSSSMLAGLGISAFGVANSIPLDAVIDANGVTFAGVTRTWSDIARVEPKRAAGIFGGAAELWLRSPAGDLRVGPGSHQSIDLAARQIEERLVSAQAAA